jgi:hypothetical protein
MLKDFVGLNQAAHAGRRLADEVCLGRALSTLHLEGPSSPNLVIATVKHASPDSNIQEPHFLKKRRDFFPPFLFGFASLPVVP